MAKIMLVMTHEEVNENIAYNLICFTRYGSAWDTGRRRRAWLADFTEEERRAAGRLFKQARNWTVGRGVPYTVQMSRKTFLTYRVILKTTRRSKKAMKQVIQKRRFLPQKK